MKTDLLNGSLLPNLLGKGQKPAEDDIQDSYQDLSKWEALIDQRLKEGVPLSKVIKEIKSRFLAIDTSTSLTGDYQQKTIEDRLSSNRAKRKDLIDNHQKYVDAERDAIAPGDHHQVDTLERQIDDHQATIDEVEDWLNKNPDLL